MRPSDPVVSVVIPARNEADYLGKTLSSVTTQQTPVPFEVIVVDGQSTDGTSAIAREFGVQIISQSGRGIGSGRHEGAEHCSGDWLAFIDADTQVVPTYLDRMLAFVRGENLDAASARCRVVGSYRGKAKQVVVNRIFPHLRRPILPGFNFFVAASVYHESGGFPDVPNEDTDYSRKLAKSYDTAYHPEVLVETSGRRFTDDGLTGAAYHYLRLDLRRMRMDLEET